MGSEKGGMGRRAQSSSTSVYETSCLQQHFRDVHVASAHMMVGEPVMELAGRVMLGLDDKAFGL